VNGGNSGIAFRIILDFTKIGAGAGKRVMVGFTAL